VAAVRGGGLGGFYLIESLLDASVPLIEVSLQAVGVEHRVIGGIGIDEARINKELSAINETSFHALPDNMLKESLKGTGSPSGPGFTEDTVVGDFTVKIIA
jgi:hypothetical protein